MEPEARRQRALIEAGLALASELSLPALLQKIVDLAVAVADARYGALGIVGPDERLVDFLTYGVTDEEREAIGPLPQGKGLLGVLIREGHPMRMHRISDDPRSVGFPPNHPPMNSFLGVPVAVRGSVFGNLYLTEKQGADDFTREDEEAVVTLAAQAAVAVENARLHAQVQRLAVVEERERIARELHDDVVQSLFAEGMALQAARSMVGDPVALDARLESAVENLDRVIRDLRNYIFGLRPGVAADAHLDRALRELAEGYEDGPHIEVLVDAEIASLLAGGAADLIQAAREALSNAVRHAEAAKVTVSLGSAPGGAALIIEDDGVGFDPATIERGLGLGSLEDRARAIGGRLSIQHRAGGGTRVSIVVPI